MAEPESAEAAAERQAVTNLAAFLHWLRAEHGLRLAEPGGTALEALKRWAEADPSIAARLILAFAGTGFSSARMAAGLLLEADLRPDDLILIHGATPGWLPEALAATRGLAAIPAEATVLIAHDLHESLPPRTLRVILTGARHYPAPPGITLSHAAGWTYPSESSAD